MGWQIGITASLPIATAGGGERAGRQAKGTNVSSARICAPHCLKTNLDEQSNRFCRARARGARIIAKSYDQRNFAIDDSIGGTCAVGCPLYGSELPTPSCQLFHCPAPKRERATVPPGFPVASRKKCRNSRAGAPSRRSRAAAFHPSANELPFIADAPSLAAPSVSVAPLMFPRVCRDHRRLPNAKPTVFVAGAAFGRSRSHPTHTPQAADSGRCRSAARADVPRPPTSSAKHIAIWGRTRERNGHCGRHLG